MDNFDKVDSVLARTIQANPKDPFAWHIIGVRHFSRQEFNKSLDCFEKAESIKAGFSAANLLYLAMCQRELGRSAECANTLEKAANCTAINKIDKKSQETARKLLHKMEHSSSVHQIVEKARSHAQA